MIAQRKRMLQTFLNRLAKHPVLSSDHVFHRFLDGEVSWVRGITNMYRHSVDAVYPQTEVLNSPPLSNLPKNILKAPSSSPTDSNASMAYAALPNPSAAHPLRNPDQRFLDSEAFTNKFAAHVSGPMEKVTRRAIKRWAGKSSLGFSKRLHLLISLWRLLTRPCRPRCRPERIQSERKWRTICGNREDRSSN